MLSISACVAVTPEAHYVRMGASFDRKTLAQFHAQAAWGTVSGDATFAVGVSLPAATFSGGEPMQLLVSVTNRSEHMVPLYTGFHGNFVPWLNIVVVKPDRKLAELRNPARILTLNARISGRVEFLEKQRCSDCEVDLNQMFDLSQPGQYLVYAKREIDGGELVSGNALFVIAPSSSAPVPSPPIQAASIQLASRNADSVATLASSSVHSKGTSAGLAAQNAFSPAQAAGQTPSQAPTSQPVSSPAQTPSAVPAILAAGHPAASRRWAGLLALALVALIAAILLNAARRQRQRGQ